MTLRLPARQAIAEHPLEWHCWSGIKQTRDVFRYLTGMGYSVIEARALTVLLRELRNTLILTDLQLEGEERALI